MKGAIYDETGLGLYYYGTRWFDPLLGRWIQPDSIVPLVSQGVQAWDRFAYVNNSPVRFTDPTGHDRDCGIRDPGCKNTIPQNRKTKLARPNPTLSALKTKTANTPSLKDAFRSTPTPGYSYRPGATATPTAIKSQTQFDFDVSDVLSGTRKAFGEIDPFIPNQFTGTNLGYPEAVRQAAQTLNQTIAPGNPLSKVLVSASVLAPIIAPIYNISYDQATNTGEYSENWNIRDMTPQQAAYAVVAFLVVFPLLPP